MKRYLPVVVILFGILLRWCCINWSLPDLFHPDEVRLLYAVQEISRENLNPKFFAYGSLPIYVLKILYETGKKISPHANFFLIGRTFSAFFGSLTLIVLYHFGKRFFSKQVALLSTAFLAFTVLHIQLSHFLTVDVMLTFFILLTLYFLASLVEGEHPFRYYFLAGMSIGLALATKISALPLYGVFLGAHILMLLKLRWASPSRRCPPEGRRWTPPAKWRPSQILSRWTPPGRWGPSLSLWGMFILALLLSGIVFFLCEPYAFLDFNEFYRQAKEQSNMVRGIWQPPYVIQYENTIPYVYYIKQLLLYAMGLPLGLLILIGSLFITLETILKLKKGKTFFTHSDCTIVLILLWVLPVFGIVGGFSVKFLRYMLPLIPFLCLLGAIFAERLIQRFPSWRLIIYGVVSITIGFSAFYAVAFVSIYHRDDPRKQASKWIYEHVRPGSTILTESWEFTSLVSADGHHGGQYRMQRLDLYAPDSEKKIQALAQQLSKGNVIFLATKRLYGSILRIPERYPLTVNYYKQLFDGNLGFTPVKVFTSYPSLFGITFNDDFADESFSVYDHPKVILFQKTEGLSGEKICDLLAMAPTVDDPASLLKRLLAFPGLESEYSSFNTPLPPLKGGIPTPDPSREGNNTPLPPLKGGIPTPDPSREGNSEWQAIVIWLLAVEFLAIIAFPFTTLTFRNLPDMGYAVSKVVGILLPAYVVWILVSLKLLTFTREVIVIATSVLFLASLLILLKYLSSFLEILRTKWRIFLIHESVFLLAFIVFLLFRAYNPDIFWSESSMDFSFLNVLMRAETLPPPDPWISGFPLNYYYFGHYIVAMLTRLTGIPPHMTYNLAFAFFPALVFVEVFSVLYNLTKRYFWGIVGVFFSSTVSNLDGFYLLVDLLRGKEHSYRFFRCAHEVIPYTVHEFPFWTFIFVDLHAHLLNMPFLIAVFLVGLNMLSEIPSWEGLGVSLFLYTLLVGTLAVISSWDYPTAVIFLLLVTSAATYRNFKNIPKNFFFRIRPLLSVICVIIPGSILLYLPFYMYFHRKGMKLGWVGSSTTQFSDFYTIFGLFFFVILSFLAFQTWRLCKNGKPLRMFTLLLLPLLGIYAFVLYVFHINYATFLFVVFILLFSSYIFAKQQQWQVNRGLKENIFIWICLGYACMIVAGCEIVFVRDFLQGGEYKRMNTIFKFYIPVWFLLSFTTTYMLYKLREQYFQENEHIPQKSLNRYIVWIWVVYFGILSILSVIFPVMVIYARRHHWDVYARVYLPPTLNGLAYINAQNPDEYRAILWLNEQVGGTPVILEATGADYLYEYGRISANTGLPTVLGWPSHADQREHWEHTHQRSLDIKEIYTSSDIEQVRRLLRKYDVKYIYVGKTERKDFTEVQLKKFQNHPEYFEVVFQSGETVIYRAK